MEQVSACLVTRGDVDMQSIIDSLPSHWEIVIWDNGERMVSRSDGWKEVCQDLSVYGRYAAIEHARHDLIYVQDDDVIVGDPQAIVRAYLAELECDGPRDCTGTESGRRHCFPSKEDGLVVCNMPPEFRHSFYEDNALVGFGAVLHRNVPDTSFSLIMGTEDVDPPFFSNGWEQKFYRTCDIAVTALANQRVLVDIPITHLPHAYGPNRMYREDRHVGERTQMRALMKKVPR